MTSSEQKELGELTAEVRGMRDDLTRIGQAVQHHDKRIDSLEGTRDEGRGGAKLIALGKGFGTFILALLAALGLTKVGA